MNEAIRLSHPHPCDYLPGHCSQMLFLPSTTTLSINAYSRLVAQGFRRSGGLVYRPHCPRCRACIPVRVPVASFRPNRGQRRCWRKNSDLQVITRTAEFRWEHYDLYRRYVRTRHGDSPMADTPPEDYRDFLICPGRETLFYEFRHRSELMAVAVSDLLIDGLSAVYSFYDPACPQRGLGTYAILWQIEAARRLRLQWLYLGYWIPQCSKMAYKSRFRPMEYLHDDRWLPFSNSGVNSHDD